jgi:DNA primase
MKAEEFVQLLDKVQPKGHNKWMACCPAHEDKSPSLAVTESPDGKILLRCFAGCDALDVVHSLNLELADLFDKPLDYSHPMAFAIKERNQKERKNVALDRYRMVLSVADGMRKRGDRLSDAMLKEEREAFIKIREIGGVV